MGHQLNPEQERAVANFEVDLVVSAGAGTGKTSVLTNKYLRLLEERRAEVPEIIAITFTNKAAAEMRLRIQQGIKERQLAANGPEESDYWKNQLQKVENARISTFHSLCLSLVREHPLETGIPPAIAILGEGEEAIYLRETINTVITEVAAADPAEQPVLIPILNENGLEGLTLSLAQIYAGIRESGRSISETVEFSIAKCQTAIESNPVQVIDLLEELKELLGFSQGQQLTERAEEILAELRNDLPVIKETLTKGAFTEIIAGLADLKKALPKNLPNLIKPRIEEIHQLAEAISRKLLDQAVAKRLPVIGQLLAKIDQSYSRLKLEKGLLDFTDQQLLARDLLWKNPELARRVRQGVRYLLVDECQDTNGLQLDLINLLRGEDNNCRMMAVGDIKQSIYRFRGAEARLINNLAAQVESQGGELISLSQNYRSNATVIRFINQLSQQVFEAEDFQYEPLNPFRGDEGSRIEMLLTGSTDRGEEAQLVAARIAALVREGQADYGDIVLLFRAGTAVFLYQQALQELGIPFFTSCGGDFYHRQEIVDQLNLLRIVQQKYDSLALLGLLTSPYVGLSETALFWLGSGQNLVEAFYESTSFPDGISRAEQERLLSFRDLLIFLQQNREILQIPGILRLALERCHYREVLWSLPNAAQRLANLEKLLVKAEEFVERGFSDLHRFLSYIEQLEGMELVEGEAQTQGEQGGVVRLMTIHRAKGLEFPVVFLVDLDRQFKVSSRGRLAFHKDAGLGLTFPVEATGAVSPSLWEEIKELNKREEISELKRVLYVALTRAKQQLILVGSGNSRSKGKTLETANSWMRWLELLMPLENSGPLLDFFGVPVVINREVAQVSPVAKESRLLDEYRQKLSSRQFATAEPEVAATALAIPKLITLKVSEILVYKNCPRRYFWEYMLRLKEAPVSEVEADLGSSGTARQLGAFIGTFFHQAAYAGGTEWPEELWLEHFKQLEVPGRERAQLKADLQLIWTNFQNSPYTGKDCTRWDEAPFLVKLTPETVVEGRFDRLLATESGKLVLVDYKTHRVQAEQARYTAGRYFWQLQLYAMAIESLWHQLPDQAILYFPYCNESIAVPLDREPLAETRREVENMADFLRTHQDFRDYPRNTEYCINCHYKWFCDQGD